LLTVFGSGSSTGRLSPPGPEYPWSPSPLRFPGALRTGGTRLDHSWRGCRRTVCTTLRPWLRYPSLKRLPAHRPTAAIRSSGKSTGPEGREIRTPPRSWTASGFAVGAAGSCGGIPSAVSTCPIPACSSVRGGERRLRKLSPGQQLTIKGGPVILLTACSNSRTRSGAADIWARVPAGS